jgi:uncharacterized membrane protein YeiH
LILDRPAFWIADQTYLVCALLAGVVTFAVVRLVPLPRNLFLIPDAVGLALFTVVGTQIALLYEVPWLAATFLGVVTGVFGGVLRDMLSNEVPLVFGGELYGTAAWAGALLYVGLWTAGAPAGVAAGCAFACIVIVRLAAIRWRITLPSFAARRRLSPVWKWASPAPIVESTLCIRNK